MSEQLREYELVYIIQPELDETGITAVDNQLKEMITRQQGEITETELWGKRNLAYPIKFKYFEGYYILHRMKIPGSALEEVERVLRFNEDVLRYLYLRLDE
ncbi:30S ribosomal protein S6 [Chloroflexi bacterium TSY]|nr:30S ribosomal protein S6 [Chloroflexi bacterium TSY]